MLKPGTYTSIYIYLLCTRYAIHQLYFVHTNIYIYIIYRQFLHLCAATTSRVFYVCFLPLRWYLLVSVSTSNCTFRSAIFSQSILSVNTHIISVLRCIHVYMFLFAAFFLRLWCAHAYYLHARHLAPCRFLHTFI